MKLDALCKEQAKECSRDHLKSLLSFYAEERKNSGSTLSSFLFKVNFAILLPNSPRVQSAVSQKIKLVKTSASLEILLMGSPFVVNPGATSCSLIFFHFSLLGYKIWLVSNGYVGSLQQYM